MGKGIYDTGEMFDQLTINCDGLLKNLFGGNRVAFCVGITEMIQMIGVLKDGVLDELQKKDERIRELEAQLTGGDPDAVA